MDYKEAYELLAFHDGSEEPAREGGHPVIWINAEDYKKILEAMRHLLHEFDSTRGLWCIDRKPSEVDKEWIERNAFQLG